jgi:plasmid stabilization system protein ParE
MTPRLLIRPEAQVDLEEAVLWYEEQRPGLGEVLSRKIFELIDRITAAPLHFPSVAPSVRRGLLQRFPYAIYFLLENDPPEVVIIAILHQHRDPAMWKRRR